MKVVLAALLVLAPLLAYSQRDPSGEIYYQHSLVKPFLTSGVAIANWDFAGNAVISDEFIRLTPDRQSKKGAVWNSRPCGMGSWEVTIEFKVHGQGKHLFGDGWAFWYTRDRQGLGPVFGNQNYFVGLGVFFDTYSNHQQHHHGHPYISALVNDGSMGYDHDTDGTHQEVSGCQSFFRNVDFPTFVRITYARNVLKVDIDARNQHTWETCFMVADVHLPQNYYFGVSASTGELADNHDIVSVKVAEPAQQAIQDGERFEGGGAGGNNHEEPYAGHHAPERDHVYEPPADRRRRQRRQGRGGNGDQGGSSGGGWFWTILIVLVLGAAGGGAGFYYYKKQQNTRRFHF